MENLSVLQFVEKSFTENRLWLQKIPGDGNCLFGSLAHQFHGVHPLSKNYSVEVSKMRKRVAGYIREHLDEYFCLSTAFCRGLLSWRAVYYRGTSSFVDN